MILTQDAFPATMLPALERLKKQNDNLPSNPRHGCRFFCAGSTSRAGIGVSPMITCSIPDCTRPVKSQTYCELHYTRMRKHGSPDKPKPYARTGYRNANWRGGRSAMPDGRVLIHCPDHPNPGVAGVYVLRYRLVMEKALGRFLTNDEIVHHKNGNPTDDRIENLEVMTQAEHARIHAVERHITEPVWGLSKTPG